MNKDLMNLLSNEEVMKEFLEEANKAAEENPQNSEAGIKKLQDFCILKGIKDCSADDVKEILSLIKDTTEKVKNKNIGTLTEADIEEVVGGGYGCCYRDFDYEREEKYWKKLIRNIALYSTAAVAASSLIIGGTVVAVKKATK